MLNINPKLLETLKQRNIKLNFTPIADKSLNQNDASTGTTLNESVSTFESSHNSNEKNQNFRIRPCTPGQGEYIEGASSLAKQKTGNSDNLSASKMNFSETAMMSTTGGFKIRPVTSQGTKSPTSNKLTRQKSDSKQNEDEEEETDSIPDRDDFIDDDVITEIQIFNDIADLTEEKLAEIVRVEIDELSRVTRAELKVDLSFNSLSYVGELMTSLQALKLNNSIISSLRDIGTTFKNLQIIWISKSNLTEIYGLNSFPNLKELYASYNNIKEIRGLISHQKLEILDLEGNELNSIDDIQGLGGLRSLSTLNLNNNQLSKSDNYKKRILELIPTLEILDELPIKGESSTLSRIESNKIFTDVINETDFLYEKFKKYGVFSKKDIEEVSRSCILTEVLKEPSEEEIITMSVKKKSKKAEAMIENDLVSKLSIKATGDSKKEWDRPKTAGMLTLKKSPSIFTNTDKLAQETYISDLVQQTDKIFVGNPLKALRHRRNNEETTEKSGKVTKGKDIMKLIEEFEITNEENDLSEENYENYDINLSSSSSTQSLKEEQIISTAREIPKENIDTRVKVNIVRQRKYNSVERLKETPFPESQPSIFSKQILLPRPEGELAEVKPPAKKGMGARIQVRAKIREIPTISNKTLIK